MAIRRKRVLLFGNGEPYHLGAFFRKALENLGVDHCFFDESRYPPGVASSLFQKGLHRITGKILNDRRINRDFLDLAASFRPDILLIIKGSGLQPETLAQAKNRSHALLVNYSTDNPFNPFSSTRQVAEAIPLYDLYLTPRKALIPTIEQAGAKRLAWLPFGYEPALHFPESPGNPEEARRWASDVVFAGGCDGDRSPVFVSLAQHPEIQLSLYGGYWDQRRELRRFWHGFALGRDYRLALGNAKIALGMVRQSNRDGHAMRSFEIPACGGFLLAERTQEHLELFEEGKEMACFSSTEELLDKLRYYLSHDEVRRRTAQAGFKRVTGGKHAYQDRVTEILRLVDHV